MKNILTILLILSLSVSFSSCVQTPDPKSPKRISFLYNVGEVGETIVVGQDSIVVDEIKLLADRFNMVLPDSVVLQTSIDALVMTYRSEFNGEDENVLSANIGFDDIDRFQGIQLFVRPPQDTDNIQDSDFFGNPDNFSFVFRGSYNSQNFEYKSNTTFDKFFDFASTIELNNEEETLIVRVTLNVSDIVIDEAENAIMDPKVTGNQAKIDSLLGEQINIEAFAGNVF